MMLNTGLIVPVDLNGRPIGGGYYAKSFKFRFNATHGQSISMPSDAVGKTGLLFVRTTGSSWHNKTSHIGYHLLPNDNPSQFLGIFPHERVWNGGAKTFQRNVSIPSYYVAKEYNTGSRGAPQGYYNDFVWFVADCILYY